ncbi:MAG TPA: family 16 glycoside hydrolase [Terriglobia bacterium]|nr:family 16 glycoside hydrolase [Terriglobia bacterium]
MVPISRRELLASLILLPAALRAEDDWIPLFDGRSLTGWKASENESSFRVVDGQIAADGLRSHLFYTGGLRNAGFKNFELKADVLTRPGANSGIYFHTRFQEGGWPAKGFEVQINNTQKGDANYVERRKTGSLYGVRNVFKAFADDNKWFQLHVQVRAKQVKVRLNDTLLVDYVEPDPPVILSDLKVPVLDHGTFALQCHDPGSKVFFRNILVRPLPDDLPMATTERAVVDDVYRELLRMNMGNFPVVDYHTHLKGGLTLEEALAESRRLGIMYGIAVNCGLGFPITNDAGAEEFLASMKGQSVFVAMQGEGREWVKLFSKETIAKFDYAFTDAMTFTDDSGKRMRLWIKEEVGEIPDKDGFMKMYVDRILGVLNNEPIDIYVNPTFLPEVIAADYDRLWTPERMQKVIDAANKNGVAIEINSRYRLPSAAFIKAAKKGGVKFSFGTNNGERDLGRLEYCVAMAKECGLEWRDVFVPKPPGEKAVERRGRS